MGEKVEDADESSSKREVLLSLGSARQIFVFEIPGNPRQDVWDMLDQAEAFLARERDGIIVADEGVFDGAMKQILAFGDPRVFVL